MEHNKLSTYLLIAITVLLLVTVVFNYQINSNLSNLAGMVTKQPTTQQGSTQPTQPTQPTIADVKVGDAPVKGPENAKVTIVVFSDPSCPFCAAAAGASKYTAMMQQRSPGWEAPVPNIIKNYVDTGKARIAFKYFPGHGKGEYAMKLMWCANEQGKFWQIHDLMFNNQDQMESGDTGTMNANAKNVAGINGNKLDACLNSGKYDSKLSSDTKEGEAAGVSGTPAFFINGKLIEGAQPYSAFKTVIDQALNA